MRTSTDRTDGLRALRWPLRLTWAGMLAETLVQAFWPMLTLCLAVLALLMMGLQERLTGSPLWAVLALVGLSFLGTVIFAVRRFRVPSQQAALARLDASLPGRPIRALLDDQAIGAGDAASAAVWQAHQKRMAERAAQAQPVKGDLRVAKA
ncbi:DUF4175 family protein, partial [Pseudomonas sp. AMR01]|uniref:DUF4175 family protein n=1 Tax=Pseudomonas sp. AMR01 TaxID=3064904 RepID=UPI0035BF3829